MCMFYYSNYHIVPESIDSHHPYSLYKNKNLARSSKKHLGEGFVPKSVAS